jgi:transitional endoplasmic reticulum ATPase
MRRCCVMGASSARSIAVAPHYDPKGVSLEGSVDTLVNKLTRVDRMLRSGGELNAGAATMLFYGPPGTGKTALARYLADRMDRECKVVRASDLLGPYVGMTEANIAEVFRDAKRDDAVLVIDEADSFLFPREMAHAFLGDHPWSTNS